MLGAAHLLGAGVRHQRRTRTAATTRTTPRSGFADRNNPHNPFRDWNIVFVSYCSCDIHFGDAAQDYPRPMHVEHRGYHNARVVEKWAREHFVNPEEVFVTGSSAGAYGAWFHAPLLHEVWPNAHFHVLADAGNGVITQDFLDDHFPNWNFEANLPDDIPGLREVLRERHRHPRLHRGGRRATSRSTSWAHYSTAFDGGTGGQTGFYNVMLNDNNPIAALTWWDAQLRVQRADARRRRSPPPPRCPTTTATTSAAARGTRCGAPTRSTPTPPAACRRSSTG